MQQTLMSLIDDFVVPRNAVALWWFGQNGYIFKSPEGTLVSVDLYLSNHCAAEYPRLNLQRKVPVLLAPQEVRVDVYACTHSHHDHLDPETVAGLRNKDTTLFVGAGECEPVYRTLGIEDARLRTVWPRATLENKDLRLTTTFALPTDETDLNHVGFLLQFGHGPKIYITGDTDHHPLLYSVAEHSPDLMISCVNGGFNNLSHWEAADLAAKIKPRVAIPCHYDMFEDNACDPHQFEVALKVQAPETVYQRLRHATPFVFSKDL
jgi:L-ascorbate 6-phosphate lactonase